MTDVVTANANAETQAPAPTPGPAGGPTPETTGPMTIRLDSLPEDLRVNKTVSGLAGQPIDKALRMLVAAEGLIGKRGVPLPAGPEDKAGLEAFRKAIGVPASPDLYPAPTLPPGLQTDPQIDRQLRAWAHKFGWTPDQYKGFAEELAAWNVATHKQQAAEQEAARERAKAALRTELGPAYDAEVQLANTAAAAFADEAELSALREAGYLEDPTFLKLMAKVGRAISPDRLHGNRQGQPSASTLEAQILEKMQSEAYRTQRGPAHDRVLEEILQLRKQLAGSK